MVIAFLSWQLPMSQLVVNTAARHLGPLSLMTPMPSLSQPGLVPPLNSAVSETFLHGNVPADGQSRHIWEQHREAIIRSLDGEAQRIPYVVSIAVL